MEERDDEGLPMTEQISNVIDPGVAPADAPIRVARRSPTVMALRVLLCLAIAPSNAAADRSTTVAEAVLAAVKADKAAGVAAHLQAPLRYEGLAFDDAACARQFKPKGTVLAARTVSFARCLLKVRGIRAFTWVSGVDGVDATVTDPDFVGSGGRIQIWIARKGKREIVRIAVAYPQPSSEQIGIEGGAP